MTSLGDAKAVGAAATLQGVPVEVRRFLIDGKPTACLAEEVYPRFVEVLTKMYDTALAEEVSGYRM